MAERPYNFSAGPAMMPVEVLEQASEGLVDWGSRGVGVPEMSHRSDEFQSIAEEAKDNLRDLMFISDEYEILFLQGGATGQFAAVPLNLAKAGETADYAVTGIWSEKAVKEAAKFVKVQIVTQPNPYTTVPEEDWQISEEPAYTHITPNETINGVAFSHIPPEGGFPLVADMSSSILSEPVDVDKFSVIYAGAQKNIGPAGLTIVIAHRQLLEPHEWADSSIPVAWDWYTQAEASSMINTPPTLGIYMAGLVFKWLKHQGGMETMAEVNQRKAAKLYEAIDGSELYSNPVEPEFRSKMNVPFILRYTKLEQTFLEEAGNEALVNLEGHRSVGGLRASIYNAMPEEGVDKLVAFMRDFEERHS